MHNVYIEMMSELSPERGDAKNEGKARPVLRGSLETGRVERGVNGDPDGLSSTREMVHTFLLVQ